MRSWLVSRPGDPYTENNAGKDAQKIREKYGERAYIQAEVSHNEIVSLTSRELDLVYAIKENDKIHVARLIFEGNTKTREEVLRREFTRTGFMPGEEYNSRNLQRAIQRIKDRGWVEAQGGIAVRTQETEEPQGRDVVIDVREGQTGTVRLAAGFSSSFGILGLLEFTQRNFDIADLPSSFEDLVNGTGFAGGGQFLRLRLAPAARRQSYTADFREPYVFGHEFGMDIRGYATNTFRESYNDRRVGAAISFDKRFEPLTARITINGYRVDIDDVEINAPLAVRELTGSNTVFSIVPALIYDSRDSFIFPTEGLRFLLSEEYAGQILPGDFDFHKLLFEAEGHVTLYETEGHLRHVGSVAFTFGWAHAARRVDTVPLIERFYAGGRDSIRGFEFRGVGPREQGDPVGGEAYVLGTIEYSYPLFVEFLRGAFFYDIANLSSRIENLNHDKWRNTVGFGIRFLIPQLANIPVKLDFGFPLTKEDDDERQTVTFDIGALF
jgi:outer membrane protein insertion porin family